MNKKHFLMMLIISLPLFFTGCVEDMYEDTTSLEELYRQKAAEFSKKYGVDVTIQEDSIPVLVATKSIAELEADIKEFAKMNFVLYEKSSTSSLKKRMKIARQKTLQEQNSTYEGTFSASGTFTHSNKMCSCDATGEWSYTNPLQKSVSINITYSFGNYYDEINYTFADPNIQMYSQTEVYIDASGKLKFNCGTYAIRKEVSLTKSCGTQTGTLSFSN